MAPPDCAEEYPLECCVYWPNSVTTTQEHYKSCVSGGCHWSSVPRYRDTRNTLQCEEHLKSGLLPLRICRQWSSFFGAKFSVHVLVVRRLRSVLKRKIVTQFRVSQQLLSVGLYSGSCFRYFLVRCVLMMVSTLSYDTGLSECSSPPLPSASPPRCDNEL